MARYWLAMAVATIWILAFGTRAAEAAVLRPDAMPGPPPGQQVPVHGPCCSAQGQEHPSKGGT